MNVHKWRSHYKLTSPTNLTVSSLPAGLDTRTIKRYGMGLYEAYIQMYFWVTGQTACGSPSYAPVLVAHRGFGLHFEILQKELMRESEARGLHCPEEALDVPAEWRFLDTQKIANTKGWPWDCGKGLVET